VYHLKVRGRALFLRATPDNICARNTEAPGGSKMLHEIYSAAASLKPKSRRGVALQLLPLPFCSFCSSYRALTRASKNFASLRRPALSMPLQSPLKPLSIKDKTALAFL
jgi:hypothetical protein